MGVQHRYVEQISVACISVLITPYSQVCDRLVAGAKDASLRGCYAGDIRDGCGHGPRCQELSAGQLE